LTPNGKLDRNALPVPDRHRDADHQPPRNPVETVLAGLFAEVLGLDRVGIHDNFFELGGDSIQSIQVVSRARAAGVAITPKQIFQYQTVATLAQVADQSQTAVELDLADGPAPLTPIQRWFFAQRGPKHHFNQAVLLEVPGDIKPARLERTLAALIIHHDALRSRFVQNGADWLQETFSIDDVPFTLAHFDLAELAPDGRVEQLQIAAATLQQSLDPIAGRLVAAAWFDFGPETSGRLLLIIHHLVIDGVSWRILIEDLIAGYNQLERSETVTLPARTTPFGSWARKLASHAESTEIASELAFWTSTCRDVAELSLDRPVDPHRANYGDTEGMTTALSAEETQALLTIAPLAYRSRINDALLAALSIALAEWRSERGENGAAMLVDLEGHGREDIFGNVDLSRTVGWFTTMFPVRLDASELNLADARDGGPAAGIALRQTKEQLRAIPSGGIGWGLLRHLNAQTASVLSELPRAQLSFNYLGRFDESTGDGWRAATESSGPAIAPERGRDHLLEIVTVVKGGTLLAEWRWWPAAHDRASIADLADRFTAALRGVIRHCGMRDASSFTPSDFPLVRLDDNGLASLQQNYPDIEDIWPLAPMQHVMMTHARRWPESFAYHEQLCLTLEGELDRAALEAAWSGLSERQAALRAAFPAGESSIQVVRRDARPGWRAIDWSQLDPEHAERRLHELLAEDRAQGFDLACGSPLRAILLRLDTLRHTLILSFHHVLLDGWSIPIMLRELMQLYSATRRRQPADLPPPPRYRDYLAWLCTADPIAGRAFWLDRLRGVSLPHRLNLPEGEATAGPDLAGEHRVLLPEPLTADLQALAQARRLTLNALVQGAWSLALARHGAVEHEVLFGMTTAGRSGEVRGVEQIIGLCTNMLPRRIRLIPTMHITDWLADLQGRQAEEQSHDRCPLGDIQRWCGVPDDDALFESVVVFENYPINASDAAAGQAADLRVTNFDGYEDGIDFPLCLTVAPGARMSFRLTFSRRRFDAAAISCLLDDVVQVLSAMATDPDRRLATLVGRS
jgi:non-ribosomal peptide synthase protein (TIGR01720 family)